MSATHLPSLYSLDFGEAHRQVLNIVGGSIKQLSKDAPEGVSHRQHQHRNRQVGVIREADVGNVESVVAAREADAVSLVRKCTICAAISYTSDVQRPPRGL
jgi:hypothetical protein